MQMSQTRTVLKEQGRSQGRARKSQRLKDDCPAPRTTQTPTPLAGACRKCASYHRLELLPAKPAAQSPCLDCHQRFLLCVLDPVQGSRRSCGWGT